MTADASIGSPGLQDIALTTAEGFFSKGFEAHRQGALIEAGSFYRRTLIMDPTHPDAWHLSGVLSYQDNRPLDMIRSIRRALRGKTQVAAYYSNLGLGYLEAGYSGDACRTTGISLILDPAGPDALINHASANREHELPAQAERWGLRAIALDPAQPVAQSALGHTLLSSGSQHREALLRLKNALALAPANPKALFYIGLCLAHLGKSGTKLAFAAAARLMPSHKRALISLATVHRFTSGDEWMDRLHAAIAEAAQEPEEVRIALQFSLAKAHDDLGEKQISFDHLLLANTMKRNKIVYDEDVTLRLLSNVAKIFSPALIREKEGMGFRSTLPIFIIGLPRSGTSLVEQILASHPDVHGAGELPLFPDMLDRFSTPEEIRFPQIVPALAAEAFAELGQDYSAAIRRLNSTARFITDKMPGNLVFAGMIHLALPDARFIQLRRDPVDNCLSCFSQNFSEGLNYASDLAELGRYAHHSIKLMDHWQAVLPSTTLLDVSYETLVSDQEGQTRRLLEFCGLPWDDACLSFYKTERAVKTASISQVRRPIYKSSVGRWRPPAEQIEPLLRELRKD